MRFLQNPPNSSGCRPSWTKPGMRFLQNPTLYENRLARNFECFVLPHKMSCVLSEPLPDWVFANEAATLSTEELTSAALPSAEMSSVGMHSAALPSVTMSSVKMSSAEMPSVAMSSVKMPSAEMPAGADFVDGCRLAKDEPFLGALLEKSGQPSGAHRRLHRARPDVRKRQTSPFRIPRRSARIRAMLQAA